MAADPFESPRAPLVTVARADLLRVARLHRFANRLVLGQLGAFGVLLLASSLDDGSKVRAAIAAGCIVAFASLGLALLGVLVALTRALKWAWWKTAFAVAGLLFGPISLLVILLVTDRAGRALKQAGVRVGLLGVSRETLATLNAKAPE